MADALHTTNGNGIMYWVCLSSAAKRRYREDVLRALSLPAFVHLHLRYRAGYVSPAMLRAIEDGRAKGQRALVAYLNRAESIRIVPCRLGSIASAHRSGEIVTLRIQLDCIICTSDPTDFAAVLANQVADETTVLPVPKGHRVAGVHSSGTSHYCFRVQDIPLQIVGNKQEPETWQRVVHQLSVQPDFFDVATFYRFPRFEPNVPVVGGVVRLRPGSTYALICEHYHPKDDQVVAERVELKSSSTSISTIDPRKIIDSAYDLQTISFRTARVTQNEQGVISIFRKPFLDTTGAGTPKGQPSAGTGITAKPDYPLSLEEEDWQFDLPFLVTTDHRRMILFAAILGGVLAGPHVLRIWTDSPLGLTFAAIVFSFLAGVIAVYRLPKSL